jgi:hypothetical protein
LFLGSAKRNEGLKMGRYFSFGPTPEQRAAMLAQERKEAIVFVSVLALIVGLVVFLCNQ